MKKLFAAVAATLVCVFALTAFCACGNGKFDPSDASASQTIGAFREFFDGKMDVVFDGDEGTIDIDGDAYVYVDSTGMIYEIGVEDDGIVLATEQDGERIQEEQRFMLIYMSLPSSIVPVVLAAVDWYAESDALAFEDLGDGVWAAKTQPLLVSSGKIDGLAEKLYQAFEEAVEEHGDYYYQFAVSMLEGYFEHMTILVEDGKIVQVALEFLNSEVVFG